MAKRAMAATAAPAIPFLEAALAVTWTGLAGLVLLDQEPVPDGLA
jgi:hypothetical protein